jgi:hypothetical protein
MHLRCYLTYFPPPPHFYLHENSIEIRSNFPNQIGFPRNFFSNQILKNETNFSQKSNLTHFRAKSLFLNLKRFKKKLKINQQSLAFPLPSLYQTKIPMKSDYKRNQQRLSQIKKKLEKDGHKSLGDWIFNEISTLYNSESYGKKLNSYPKNQPVLKTGNQKLTQDAKRTNFHNLATNLWLKKHLRPDVKTPYIFLPNEMNQRIALAKIFENFDVDGNDMLDLNEFVDMFVKNYISNIYCDHQEIDLNMFVGLGKNLTFNVDEITKKGKPRPENTKQSQKQSNVSDLGGMSPRSPVGSEMFMPDLYFGDFAGQVNRQESVVTDLPLNFKSCLKSTSPRSDNNPSSSKKQVLITEDSPQISPISHNPIPSVTQSQAQTTEKDSWPIEKLTPDLLKRMLNSNLKKKTKSTPKTPNHPALPQPPHPSPTTPTDLKTIKFHLKKKFKSYFLDNTGSLTLNLSDFIKLTLSDDNNRLFTLLMREFNDELNLRSVSLSKIENLCIPFSFEKMVSFLAYRSQRHDIFVKFLSLEDWSEKIRESLNLFALKTDQLMDYKVGVGS